MQPRLLSALRIIPVSGTELHRQVSQGSFQAVTEWEAVSELRDLLNALDLQSTVFRAQSRLQHRADRGTPAQGSGGSRRQLDVRQSIRRNQSKI